MGNKLERASERYANRPAKHMSYSSRNSQTGWHRPSQAIWRQWLRYQHHLSKLPQRVPWRNGTPQLDPPARLRQPRPGLVQNVLFNGKTASPVPLGGFQHRQPSAVWSHRRQPHRHWRSPRPPASRIECSSELVQLHRNSGPAPRDANRLALQLLTHSKTHTAGAIQFAPAVFLWEE